MRLLRTSRCHDTKGMRNTTSPTYTQCRYRYLAHGLELLADEGQCDNISDRRVPLLGRTDLLANAEDIDRVEAMRRPRPKPLTGDSLLWEIAAQVSDERPANEQRAKASVVGVSASTVLAVLAAILLVLAALDGASGYSSNAGSQWLTFTGIIALGLAVVVYTRSTSDIGYAIVQVAIRKAFKAMRWVGLAITAIALSLSLGLLLWVGMSDYAEPAGPLSAALVLAIVARVNWGFTRDSVPALLPIDPKDSDGYHAVRPLIQWAGYAAILFASLGLANTIFSNQNVLSASIVVAIALTMYARATADTGAIGQATDRLESALSNTIVALTALQHDGDQRKHREKIQKGLLDLEAAASNNGASRLVDRIVRVDPVHLMMIAYIGREIGELDMRFGLRQDPSIRARLRSADIEERHELVKASIGYLSQLRRRLIVPAAQQRAGKQESADTA